MEIERKFLLSKDVDVTGLEYNDIVQGAITIEKRRIMSA